jgi:hypothetical protein
VIGTLDDEKWRDIPTVATNAGDCSYPFSIARLYTLASSALIRLGNDHSRANLAHHEASLVKVIEVAVKDAVFGSHVRY